MIELMVVIAIVGVLASVAIPAYQDYVGKAQHTEAMAVGGSLKQAVVIYYGTRGVCPRTYDDGTDDGSIGGRLDYAGRYVHDSWVRPAARENGICQIVVRFGVRGLHASLKGKAILLNGDMTKSMINWQCVSEAGDAIRPKSCAKRF